MTNPRVDIASELSELLSPLKHRSLKLVIHAGTPKTGTTSIQTYLDKNQRKLRGKGILYPHNIERIKNPHAPKHQWLEKNLVSTHAVYFLENIKNIVPQIKDDTHTVILSSEGVYNYWWDIPEKSKAFLTVLAQYFEVEVWIWFRDPLEFIENFYKQCIRNPQVEHNPCYGKNLTFAQMLELDWFSQHLDYQGFVRECKALFGDSKVHAIEYEGDSVQEIKQRLGLPTSHENAAPRLNKGLTTTAVELLRVINDYNVSAKDKHLLMPPLREVSKIIEGYATESLIDNESRKRVMEIARPIQF